jgi:hypothetical protein
VVRFEELADSSLHGEIVAWFWTTDRTASGGIEE